MARRRIATEMTAANPMFSFLTTWPLQKSSSQVRRQPLTVDSFSIKVPVKLLHKKVLVAVLEMYMLDKAICLHSVSPVWEWSTESLHMTRHAAADYQVLPEHLNMTIHDMTWHDMTWHDNSHSICLSPTGPSGFCYGENVRILKPTHSHRHNTDLLWLFRVCFHLTLFSWSWRWFSHSETPPPETSHFQPDSKNIFGKLAITLVFWNITLLLRNKHSSDVWLWSQN